MAGYIALTVASLALCASHLLLRSICKERLKMESRLGVVSELKLEVMSSPDEATPLQLPLSERVFYPLVRSMGRMLQSLAPAALKITLARRLNLAGMKTSAEQWAGWYIVASGGGALLGLFMGGAGTKPVPDVLFMAVLLGCGGAMLPELILRQRINRRHTQIVRALPDVLDLLTVSVNAGLGFDSALMKVTEKMKGPLPAEMGHVLHEIKMGVPRRDALKSLAERTGVDELQAFVSTIIQADQLGVSISKVLKLQAEGLRERRRQSAEEKAMKAPVKMMFPLVVFIFPTLFIVLLGPALIQILQSFMRM